MMTRPIEIDWDSYLDAMSELIGIVVPLQHRAATIAQLKLNMALAEPLLAFDIPEGTNPAPVFRP